MVEDVSRLVGANEIYSAVEQISTLDRYNVLNIPAVGRFAHDPRPDELVLLKERVLHTRWQGGREPDALHLDLAEALAKLHYGLPVVAGRDRKLGLINNHPIELLAIGKTLSIVDKWLRACRLDSHND